MGLSLLAHVALAGGAIFAPQEWFALPREFVSLDSRSGTIVIQASWSAVAPPAVVQTPQPRAVAGASPVPLAREAGVLLAPAETMAVRRIEVLHLPDFASVPTGNAEELRAELPVDRPSASKSTNATNAVAPRRNPIALELPRASLIVTLPGVPGAQSRQAAQFRDNAPPTYPAIALRNRWSGTVWLRLWIDESGKVTMAQVEQSSGHAILDSAALDAVRRWRAAPARHDGRAIASVEVQPIIFLPRRS